MRISTMRNAENNKNTTLLFANRVSSEPTASAYGDEYFDYGDVQCLEICLMPFKTEVEAKAYGVSLLGGRKATLTLEQGALFDEFTHIWVDTVPSDDRQNSEYCVKNIVPSLNSCLLIIEKKDGNNE